MDFLRSTHRLSNCCRPVTRISGLILFLALVNAFFWMPASAATNAVIGNGSPSSCTEAALVTALTAGGSVTFNCGAAPHTITFTSAKTLNSDVSIDGNNLITLSGGNNQGLFTIPQERTVILRGLKLINAPGKAIYNSGTLLLIGSTMTDNPGGAIYSAGGTTKVIDSIFERNSAVAGGAITNENGGTLSISGSTFRNNATIGSGNGGAVYGATASTNTIVDSLFELNKAASGSAGAIYNSNVMTIEHTIVRNNIAAGGGGVQNGGTMIMMDTRVTGNQATSSGGGGVAHFNQSASPSHLTLIRSTIDNNVSQQGGGGLWFSGENADLEAINSTIFSNTAKTIGGGGLLVDSGDALLTNVTFNAGTSSATDGDNVENSNTLPGTITLKNTLVVGGGCAGGVVDGKGNLEFPGTSCAFSTPSSDPGLGALAANGGWTPTHAITEGGPAQNKALNANCPATDQRGVLRPQFTTCDIGAFEWGALPVLTTIVPTSTIALSPTFTLVVHGSNFIEGTPASRVLWNGTALPTTFVNGTELQATVNASRIVAGGLVSITVETPVVDGGVSQFTAIFTIFKRDQSITFAELADRPAEPATFDLAATATSKLAVSFSASGVCAVTGKQVTLSGELGTCTITAHQEGNQSYNAAPNVVRSFKVIKPSQPLHLPQILNEQ